MASAMIKLCYYHQDTNKSQTTLTHTHTVAIHTIKRVVHYAASVRLAGHTDSCALDLVANRIV